MQTPEKYKSVPAASVFTRSVTPLNATQKANIQNIIQKFIQYLLAKHS